VKPGFKEHFCANAATTGKAARCQTFLADTARHIFLRNVGAILRGFQSVLAVQPG